MGQQNKEVAKVIDRSNLFRYAYIIKNICSILKEKGEEAQKFRAGTIQLPKIMGVGMFAKNIAHP